MVTNPNSGTHIFEIADGIYRISTPVTLMPGGFTFNQFLVVDEEPLLFHTGPRKMFSLVREAVDKLLPAERLKYIAFSHFEADECGSLNEWLEVAPQSVPVCSAIGAMVSVEDVALRAPRALADGEELSLGKRTLRWLDAPHVPHNWECGYLFETSSRTLFCGDLFTQPGAAVSPVTEGDILGPSEALRKNMGGFAVEKDTRAILEKLARTEPRTLACMHGSSFHGRGDALLRQLADALHS